MQEQITQLEERIVELEQFIEQIKTARLLPTEVDEALKQRGFMKVISQDAPFNPTHPASGTNTYYVATISGGTVDHQIVFKDGILITA